MNRDSASYPCMSDTLIPGQFNGLAFLEAHQEASLLDGAAGSSASGASTNRASANRSAKPSFVKPQVTEVFRSLPSTEELEPFFSMLRGVDLVVATLAYGLRVRVTDLKAVRVRDVNLATRQIIIEGVARQLPELLVDDLRDYIHEKLCGSDASVTVSKREQRLFSEQDLNGFFAGVSRYQEQSSPEGRGRLLSQGCLNRIFRVIGRFHSKRASRLGAKVRSPLELFDKGPRIVRRGRRGVVDAYYLWRAVYPACA